MDKWMSSKVEDSGNKLISTKRCPKCKTIITSCVRYGNIIKEHFKDVLSIRKKIFGNNQNQKRTQEIIAKKIQHQINTNCQFEYVREFLKKKLFTMKQIMTKNIPQIVLHLLDVDQYTFESLHNIVIWWKEAENNVRVNEIRKLYVPPQARRNPMHSATNQQSATKEDLTYDCRIELLGMYNNLFRILLDRKLPLSNHEIQDFEQEFTKLYDIYRLGLRRGVDRFDSFDGALNMYNLAHRHIMQNRPYDEDMQETFNNLLLNLESIVKTGWESERVKRETEARINRKSIFTSMGFGGNHWYRCSKGHLYVVADCGALNQSGACPECGSRIGSGSQNINAVRDEAAIQQQINSVVDIFPHSQSPPIFSDRSRNAGPSLAYNRGGRNRRGRR